MASIDHKNHQDSSSSKQKKSKPAAEKRDRGAKQQIDLISLGQPAGFDPVSLTPGQVVQLQRTLGNRAIGRLLIQRATNGSVVQRHGNAELQEQIETAKLEEEGAIQAKRADVQRHGNGELQTQIEEAELEETGSIQAKRTSQGRAGAAVYPVSTGTTPDAQRHNIKTSAVHTFGTVPAASEGKWKEWKLSDAVTHTELTQIKGYIGGMIMEQKLPLKEKMKLQQRLKTIVIDDSRERTPAQTPAQSFPNKLQLDTRSSTFFTPQGEIDKDTIRATLIHEMFHCLAINHEGLKPEEVTLEQKGFQGGALALDDPKKTTETLDEAVTDWFSFQIFKTVYPRGAYKTGYFAKAAKGEEEKDADPGAAQNATLLNWAGEQIPLLLGQLNITEKELLRMYLLDHAEMKQKLEAKKGPLKQAWKEKKQEALYEISPLSTKEGVKALITETCKENSAELSALARNDQFKLIQAEMKKKGVLVFLVKTTLRPANKDYVDAAEAFLNTLTPATAAQPSSKAPAGKINVSHIVKALETLNLLENQAHNPLKFLVLTPADRTDTPLNQYPDSQKYGVLPSKSLKDLGAKLDSAHEHMKTMGGAAYEAKIHTGFINTEYENNFYSYLHEVGHFKQQLQDISEYSPGMNRMLLEYHNFLLYENIKEKHTRTKYKEDIKPSGGFTFENVKDDVAGDKRMKKMVDEIEAKLKQMSPAHRELIMRNLAFEYYEEKKNMKS